MDSHSENSNGPFDCSVNPIAKLKRLKIQEGQLINSLNKAYEKGCDCDQKHYPTNSAKLKTHMIEIYNLFEEIKENTRSHDDTKETNITDIKKDIFNMEKIMKSLKKTIETKMKSLKSSEMIIKEKINDDISISRKRSTKSKAPVKPYSDIVPSPVKILIKSPAKSKEIQDYQDFIVACGRFGGWLEYNHNMFVKTWQKYFAREFEMQHEDDKYENIINSEPFSKFVQEMSKINPGMTDIEILDHVKWYLRFLKLRFYQQEAINSWKQKKMIKKGYHHYEKTLNDPKTINGKCVKTHQKYYKKLVQNRDYNLSEVFSNKISTDSLVGSSSSGEDTRLNKVKFQYDVSKCYENSLTRISRSTEQWINRCNAVSDCHDDRKKHDIDDLSRLCIPQWRSYLQ